MPLTGSAVRVWRINGAQLINFPGTCDEQRTPGAWKETTGASSSLCVRTKNRQTLVRCERYANRLHAAWHRFAVPSTHMRIWFANHSVRSCIRGLSLQPFHSICAHHLTILAAILHKLTCFMFLPAPTTFFHLLHFAVLRDARVQYDVTFV